MKTEPRAAAEEKCTDSDREREKLRLGRRNSGKMLWRKNKCTPRMYNFVGIIRFCSSFSYFFPSIFLSFRRQLHSLECIYESVRLINVFSFIVALIFLGCGSHFFIVFSRSAPPLAAPALAARLFSRPECGLFRHEYCMN